MRRLLKIAPLLVFLPIIVIASGFSPLAVTGFNYDGIVERTAVPPYSSAAQSLDLSNNALFEIGLPGTTAGGLPQGGLFSFTSNSNTYAFQLVPYNGSNLLRINPTGTLTITTPKPFTTIAVLGFSTENNGPGAVEMVGDVTLHFSDGSSSLYGHAVDLPDWFAAGAPNPNIVTAAAGARVSITSGTAAGAFEPTAGGPNFYVSPITLTTTDAAKNLTSVSFGNFPFGGNTFQFVMALGSLTPTAPITPASVPTLSTWALAVLGMLLVGAATAVLAPQNRS